MAMRVRKADVQTIFNSYVMTQKSGLVITLEQLETHYHAGGNVQDLAIALVAANKAEIPLTFEEGTAVDLSGESVIEYVQQKAKAMRDT